MGLLYLLHVRAIYLDRPWVVRLFFLLWMISSGTSVALIPLMLDGATIDGHSCVHPRYDATFIQIALAISTVHGTGVVLAMISSLVVSPLDVSFARNTGLVKRLKLSVMAKDLPTFSKSLLRHSQGYYLLLLGVNILTTIGTTIKAIPNVYQIGIFIATRALLHCTACSIFRNVGKAKYNTQDFASDLPISFCRDPVGSSPTFDESPVDVVSNEALSGPQDDR
ncbi:hypothetical protein PQX77_004231 [Marasmius sp. AFHP31]|nr:hypothetical protein PQX77_004231 [Marasmius sp. AFHP31]